MIIGMCNAKGGTGKTTSAVLLSFALTRAGHSTVLLDADRQGSATAWAELAAEAGHQFPFPVTPCSAASLTRRSYKSTQMTVIDSPPGDIDVIDKILSISDLVLIPTHHSGIDQDRMWEILDAAAARKKNASVLITMAEPSTLTYRDFIHTLDTEQVSYITPAIPRRQAITRLWGQAPDEDLFGYDEIAARMIQLCQ